MSVIERIAVNAVEEVMRAKLFVGYKRTVREAINFHLDNSNHILTVRQITHIYELVHKELAEIRQDLEIGYSVVVGSSLVVRYNRRV